MGEKEELEDLKAGEQDSWCSFYNRHDWEEVPDHKDYSMKYNYGSIEWLILIIILGLFFSVILFVFITM